MDVFEAWFGARHSLTLQFDTILNDLDLQGYRKVWTCVMTLTSNQGSRFTGKLELVQSFCWKVALCITNVCNGWLFMGDESKEVLHVYQTWIIWAFALLVTWYVSFSLAIITRHKEMCVVVNRPPGFQLEDASACFLLKFKEMKTTIILCPQGCDLSCLHMHIPVNLHKCSTLDGWRVCMYIKTLLLYVLFILFWVPFWLVDGCLAFYSLWVCSDRSAAKFLEPCKRAVLAGVMTPVVSDCCWCFIQCYLFISFPLLPTPHLPPLIFITFLSTFDTFLTVAMKFLVILATCFCGFFWGGVYGYCIHT